MYIEPNTDIILLHDVPLDTTYQHTLWFDTLNAQTTYFSSKNIIRLTKQTYQRVNKGTARVAVPADQLYNCNYMMFRNSAYGSKWFYAFVKTVDYINNECSEITYEIDVMQTWLFQHSPDYCFVEREITETDVLGEHFEPESVEVGEYVFNDYAPIRLMSEYVTCVAAVDVDSGTSGNLYDGIYGSAKLYVYDSNDVNNINSFIETYKQKPEAIIGIYMFPKDFIASIPEDHLLHTSAHAIHHIETMAQLTTDATLNGYKPKNNKLYTYPYNFYHVDNASGSDLTLRYELFDDLTPEFEISGTITQPVVCNIRPTSYKGVRGVTATQGWNTVNTETLQLTNFPMCSWNVDSYQAWVAQNSIPIAMSAGSTVIQTLASGRLNLGSIFGQVANTLTDAYRASIAADMNKGNITNGNGNVSNQKQKFYGGRCSITAQYAKIIDDYFTMFGYAVKRVKIPNRNSRPHWNYVKTIGATVTGSVPADDMNKICQIYDNGITFWKNASEVGNYSLDNRP